MNFHLQSRTMKLSNYESFRTLFPFRLYMRLAISCLLIALTCIAISTSAQSKAETARSATGQTSTGQAVAGQKTAGQNITGQNLLMVTASVSGKIVDGGQKPLAFVTVSIYKSADSMLVTGMATAGDGSFIFKDLQPGSYYIKGSFTGYSRAVSKPFTLGTGDHLQLPALMLTQAATQLKGALVTAKKPFIERQVDKTVLNIESDVIASGGTALEALKRAPGVTVDKDDNIQLRGKAGVMIMIDDKLTYMSMSQVTTMLKNMPASAVSQIEVITQPSARYDAAGNNGIINIKTKKLRKLGLNGVATAGLGYGHYPKYNGSLNLNYQAGKFNIFTNYDISRNKNYGTLQLGRSIQSANATTNFNQLGRFDNDYTNQNYKGGIDYSVAKDHTIGVQVSGYSNFGATVTNSSSYISNPAASNAADSVLIAHSTNPGTYRSIDYNLNYRGKLDTNGTSLSADFDYSKFRNSQTSTLVNTLYTPDQLTVIKGPFTIFNHQPSTISIRVGKVDFSHPVDKTFKLETGLKFSSVTTNNNVAYDSIINGISIPDKRETNQFIYTEKIAAAYVSINKSFGKNTSIQLGLRAEHTGSEGNSVTLNNDVRRSYTDLFPNISFSQKLDKDNQFGASFTRRIDRPSYDNLNPFTFYIDQYTYQVGNPYLKPQYTNAFEITHTYKSSTIIALNYSHTSNAMMQTLLQDTATKSTHQTSSNIKGINSFGFTFSTPVVIAKWWSLAPNLNINYNKYLATAADLGGALSAGKVAFNFNMTSTFTLPRDWTIELNGYYNSSAVYGYLHADPQYSVSGGIQKSFLKKKANLKLNVNDIFYTDKFSGRQPDINLTVRNRWESRRATLTFTYRFGGNPTHRHQDTGSADEKNRVKSGH